MTTPHSINSHVHVFWPALFAVATASCGNLDGHTDMPGLLATVQGQLSPASGAAAMPDDVHIAVIWQTGTPDQFNVAQDVPVEPVFPSKYALRLTEPPPDAVLMHPSGYPEIGAAYGVVVAYEDLNGNGRLDLVADDAGAFIDRIVATNPSLALFYITSSTGTLPAVALTSPPSPPTLGYNLITQSCTPVDGGLTGPDGGFCDWNVFLPIGTAYDLSFSDDPKLNSLMCASEGTSGGASGTGSGWNVSQQGTPPGGYPAVGASGLTCASDGMSYTTETCVTVQENLCTSTTQCTELAVSLGGAPKPSGWPCP
jgi:hypothetical protein